MQQKTYTTSTGIELKIRPISPDYVLAIKHSVEWPEAPTYEIEVFGGAKETVAHTEKSLQTEEDKEAWAIYMHDMNIASTEFFIKKARAIVRKCVEVEMPKSDKWIEYQEADGIEVPKDDPEELRQHYIRTECIGSQTDIFAIVDAAETASRFDEEEYRQAIKFFRGLLEG